VSLCLQRTGLTGCCPLFLAGQCLIAFLHFLLSPAALQIRLWDLDSGECLATCSGHRKQVSALRFSRSGALLALGSKGTDIVVRSVAGEAGLYRLCGHRDHVRAGRNPGM
jgi:WD40 repeat protein